MHLKDLIARIRDAWQWTAERYPKLDLTDPTAARRHVLDHLMKGLGSMAGHHERYAHGYPFGSEEHRDTAVKLLLNALQMLALENMSEDEICERLEAVLSAANA
jgi:phage gp16-like protein